MLWSSIPKRRGHKKLKKWVKKYLYNCILQHTQVLQCPIENYLLTIYINGYSESNLVSIFFTASVCVGTS